MDSLRSRSFNGTADLQAMTNLCQTLRANGQIVYPFATDLYEELADPEVQLTARLWEDDNGTLVGFFYVSQYQNLVNVFREGEFTLEIEGEIMALAERTVARRNQEKGVNNTLDASTLERDLARVALLERNGFKKQPESSILMACTLGEPIPAPSLPAGFFIRPMAGEAEIDAYVALHRSAFGTDNMTVDYRRAIMSAPDYIPELDLVAVAPNGNLAAFCVCQIFPDDAPRAGGIKEGWTDPMGTHPAYQRRGLAKALVLTGMRLLIERGIDTALLGTSSTNTAMQYTAESLGFRHVSSTAWYSKVVT